MENAQSILQEKFSHKEFRGLQSQVIEYLLENPRCFAVMPTGAGKSICYQVPALCLPGLTIVISPLIALMNEQVQELKSKGIEAEVINSSLKVAEYRGVVARIELGQLKLLYISPEKFLSPSIQALLKNCNVSLFAIDEAHCIVEWGHDFRPEYQNMIGVIDSTFMRSKVLLLTATADIETRREIMRRFKITKGDIFISSFDRPNIYLEFSERIGELTQMLRIVGRLGANSTGIIYCNSRARAEKLTMELKNSGFLALFYHAGLDNKTRSEIQAIFATRPVIIVATIAFGMGVNKQDVRFVINYDLPSSIESMYQQIGRAGRDGLNASSYSFFSHKDVETRKFLVGKSCDGIMNPQYEIKMHKTKEVLALFNSALCRRALILNYFGEHLPLNHRCNKCDNCIRQVNARDGRELLQFTHKYLGGLRLRKGLEETVFLLASASKREFPGDNFRTALSTWRGLVWQLVVLKFLKVDFTDGSVLKIVDDNPLSKVSAQVFPIKAEIMTCG